MTQQTAVEWLVEQLKEYDFADIKDNENYIIKIPAWVLTEKEEQAKQMEKKEQSLIWNKDAPKENGDYICRMDNAYIKLCHYQDGLWYDMWESDINGEVKEWMYIAYNK